MKDTPNLNYLWSSILIEELIRNGVDTFCISPGSRSTPLTTAVALNPKAKSVVHFDERAMAFYALGYGRAKGKPAAIITTSGTAVANLLPAVVEASNDCVPMLVLSADRPPELRDTTANQTIDQVKIFSDYARWQVDLPCPDEKISPAMVLTSVDQAVYRAIRGPMGPVHLNCMFREPLLPGPNASHSWDSNYLAPICDWQRSSKRYTEYSSPRVTADAQSVMEIAKLMMNTQRGVIVAGRLSQHEHPLQADAILALADTLKWPVLADVTSGLRGLEYHDAILMSEAFQNSARPEVVLHIGQRVTSKRLMEFLQKSKPCHSIVVAPHPFRQDPSHTCTFRIEAEIAQFCESLRSSLREHFSRVPDTTWLSHWQQASTKASATICNVLSDSQEVSEPEVARIISADLPANHGLFLASSMPIRDMDLFGVKPECADAPTGAAVPGANRGASGIDGTIATAAGYSRGLGRPVTLLIGDLASLHDLNSLALLRSAENPLVVVILNNDGGGIFSFLPIAEFDQVFEKYFATPHGLDFRAASEMFKVHYERPNTANEFQSVYIQALERANEARKSTVIEVKTDRKSNHRLHMEVRELIQAALR